MWLKVYSAVFGCVHQSSNCKVMTKAQEIEKKKNKKQFNSLKRTFAAFSFINNHFSETVKRGLF